MPDFSPIAIRKMNALLDLGYKITRIEYDATVHELDDQFSTLQVDVTTQEDTGTIDQFGRVTWKVSQAPSRALKPRPYWMDEGWTE
jgi:hypothetical protein